MARPSKSNPPDQFTVRELALGAGLSARNSAYVLDRGMGPDPAGQGAGRAGHRLFDSFGLAHFALIGALHRGGVELLVAARLADAVAEELGAAYGDLRPNLERYLERPLNASAPNYPWPTGPGPGLAGDVRDDFWLHHHLRIGAPAYRPGQALDGDLVLHIVDRTYVYLDVDHDKAQTSEPPQAQYRIYDWGPAAEVRPYYLDGPALDRRDAEARAESRRLEEEFVQAWWNATARLRINLSLAIRNALDAVFDDRDRRLDAFDWTATAKPPPGRYAGCDLEGRPLDPDHPWNQDLEPAARAARLAEIEAYIAERDADEADSD
jgi:hypothetical protein